MQYLKVGSLSHRPDCQDIVWPEGRAVRPSILFNTLPPVGLGSDRAVSNRQADVLHFKIVFHAVVAAFAAQTGLFDAAKRAKLG